MFNVWTLDSSQDHAKQQFAEELLGYTDAFNKAFYSCLVDREDVSEEAGNRTSSHVWFVWKKKSLFNKMLIASFHVFSSVAALDKIEDALGKFNDGPFFLGQFSLVCVAER